MGYPHGELNGSGKDRGRGTVLAGTRLSAAVQFEAQQTARYPLRAQFERVQKMQQQDQERQLQLFNAPVVLVTGAAGGIGSATCRKFAQQGYRVAGTDIVDLSSLRTQVESLQTQSGHFLGVELDVRNSKSVERGEPLRTQAPLQRQRCGLKCSPVFLHT